MRGYSLSSFDGPEGLRLVAVPEPEPAADELVLDVRAIGINYPDLLTTRGQLPGLPELPFVPGRELVGVVRQAPASSRFRPGDRVGAYVDHGGYAQRVLVAAERAVRVPDGASDSTAVAMIINYQVAYFALAVRGRLVRDEWVLVLGAGGGIGTAAIQVAHALGARTIAGVADEQQRRTASAAGADAIVVMAAGAAEQVRTIGGGGVDLVVDPVGGEAFSEGVAALAAGGRLLTLGFASGTVPTIPAAKVLARNLEILGVSWGGPMRHEPPSIADVGDRISSWFDRGLIRPVVSEPHPFEDLPGALRRLERGHVQGKAIVELVDGPRTAPGLSTQPSDLEG